MIGFVGEIWLFRPIGTTHVNLDVSWQEPTCHRACPSPDERLGGTTVAAQSLPAHDRFTALAEADTAANSRGWFALRVGDVPGARLWGLNTLGFVLKTLQFG